MRHISDNTVVFGAWTTQSDEPIKINVQGLDVSVENPDSSCYIQHENKTQGWNPKHNLRNCFLCFKRPQFVSTTNPSIIKLHSVHPP